MKKVILIAVVLVLAFSASSFAVKRMVEIDDGTPAAAAANLDNCLFTNIYPWFILWANVGYERAIGSYISVKINYSNWSAMNSIGAEILFHPMGKGLDGVYLGPKFDSWMLGDGSINWLGAIVGYGFVIQNSALLKLGVGYQFNLAGAVAVIGDIEFFDRWPAVDLGIGWVF